jgi:hypothetical protein
MRRVPYLAAALALVAVAVSPFATAPAAAAELAGVRMDDSIQVGDQSLVLNGQGLRKKLFIKVYVGGLYLQEKASDPARIVAADQPRQMVMAFLRGVSEGQMADAWNDCLEANNGGASSTVRQQFGQLSGWMSDVGDGDRMVFTYQPGEGTEVEVKGESRGRIDGKPFADALLNCWLGPEPPSEDFKDGLLGK